MNYKNADNSQNYKIIRSDRRTVSLSVKLDGTVEVRAPVNMPKSKIDGFVSSHSDWIKKVIEENKNRRRNYSKYSIDDSELDYYIKYAKKTVPERVEYWSSATGLKPSKVSISKAKTRHGSCSSTGHINISVYIMKYPPECIDYVIIHELCHLKYFNHSKDFWNLVGIYCPDYKNIKKILNGQTKK